MQSVNQGGLVTIKIQKIEVLQVQERFLEDSHRAVRGPAHQVVEVRGARGQEGQQVQQEGPSVPSAPPAREEDLGCLHPAVKGPAHSRVLVARGAQDGQG